MVRISVRRVNQAPKGLFELEITLTPLAPLTTRHQADNPARSFTLAACTDWHDVRRFPVGTGHSGPTHDAGCTTACASQQPDLSVIFGGGVHIRRVGFQWLPDRRPQPTMCSH